VRWAVVVLLALLASAPGAAADDPLDEDSNLWVEYVTSFRPRVGDLPLRLDVQLEARMRDDVREMDQARAEGFAGAEPLDDLVVGLGFLYSYRFTRDERGRDIPEYRPYVLLDLSRDVGAGVGVIARLRLDARFFDGLDPVGYRVVPRLGVALPLPSLGGVGLTLKVWDEPRWHVNEVEGGGQQEGFRENRGYAGVEAQLAPGLAFEVGYVNRYFPGRGDAPDEMDHVLKVGFELTFR
jgi:hypothetical protein